MKKNKDEIKNYFLTLTPTNIKKKQKRIFLTKYVFLVGIISFIMFIGTFIGIKVANLFPLTNEEKYIILNFLGFFFIAMFLLINIWMIMGTFFAIYSLFFIKEHKPSWKIIMIINSILIFCVYCLATLFFALFILKIWTSASITNFDDLWLVRVGDAFNQNIAQDSILNFFMTFIFAMLWSIFSLIFNIGERVMYKVSLVEFNFETSGEILQNINSLNSSNNKEVEINSEKEIEKKEVVENQENNKNQLNVKETNSKEKKEEQNESNSNEWSFLDDNSNKNSQSKSSTNGTNETKKEYDENDPNSIFG